MFSAFFGPVVECTVDLESTAIGYMCGPLVLPHTNTRACLETTARWIVVGILSPLHLLQKFVEWSPAALSVSSREGMLWSGWTCVGSLGRWGYCGDVGGVFWSWVRVRENYVKRLLYNYSLCQVFKRILKLAGKISHANMTKLAKSVLNLYNLTF